jgi:hypothetical protein
MLEGQGLELAVAELGFVPSGSGGDVVSASVQDEVDHPRELVGSCGDRLRGTEAGFHPPEERTQRRLRAMQAG